MDISNSSRYRSVTDAEGNEFYCQAGAPAPGKPPVDDLSQACVEADVVRRYSGNIEVDESPA